MSVANQHTGLKASKSVFCLLSSASVTWSSNGAPNATELAGRVIDRQALGRWYLSAKLVVPVAIQSTGLAAAAVGSVTSRLLHSTSTSTGDMVAFGSTGVTTNFTGTTAASTQSYATHEVAYDLGTARRYLQVCITGTATASSSGSFAMTPVLIFSGGDEQAAAGTILTGTSTAAYTSTSLVNTQ